MLDARVVNYFLRTRERFPPTREIRTALIMKNLDTDRKRGRWLAWKWAALASLCLAGTLFALDEIFEADTDGDGWTDAEEIIAGTDPLDSVDPKILHFLVFIRTTMIPMLE